MISFIGCLVGCIYGAETILAAFHGTFLATLRLNCMSLRRALRTLLKTPVVSLVAVISLALGIGANTAIFSVFDQISLRKLPVSAPDLLVNLTANGQRNGKDAENVAGDTESVFSYAMFRDLEKQQTVFTGIAGHCSFGTNLSYQGQSSSGSGMYVSGSYFPVLGLNPAAGRLLAPSDDTSPGANSVVVLSHAYWTSRFSRGSAILNQQVLVNGVSMTVIGVAPEVFTGTSLGVSPDVYVPISMREALEPEWKDFDNRRSYWVYMFAGRKPGVTPEQASAAMNSLFHGIINQVELPLQINVSDNYLQRFRDQKMKLESGARGQSRVLQLAETPLTILLAITGFVLLIACANVANLLLARAISRGREISIRLAMGANRRQLIAQLLTESVLLALAGSVAGLAVSYATVRALVAFLPARAGMPISPSVHLRSLAFALFSSLITGLLFGLFPAVHSTRRDMINAIKDDAGSVSSSAAAARFRKALIVGQIALSLLLLISAGLFLKSLVGVMRVDLGMRTHGILTFRLSPTRNQYKPEQIRNFYPQLEAAISALPGVEVLTASMVPLISGSNWGTSVFVEGFSVGLDTDRNARFNRVGPGFFHTMAIPLLGGREFSPRDDINTPKVAIVSEAFQRKFSATGSIVGKHLRVGRPGPNESEWDTEIIGLAHDAHYSTVKDPPPPMLYLPYRQDKTPGDSSFYLLVQGNHSPAASSAAVRSAVAALDPNLPIEDLRTFETQINENVFLDRMISTLAATFAALATVLAGVGLYGVLAYSVARRTREIGIRMAIGADPSATRSLVMKEAAWLALIGAGIGVPSAIALGRFAESQLFGIKSYDPLVIGAAAVLLAAVAMLAAYVPARAAMRVTPQTALRYE